MIDRSTIQRIMDAADIVEVVREFVTLRKAGVNYKGLCPFHHEKRHHSPFHRRSNSVNVFHVEREEML